MRKSPKSQNNKKFTVVVFYGIFAVGKYTVASEFQKRMKYKFFHNHDVYDLSRKFVDRGTLDIDRFNQNLRFAIFKEIALSRINTVVTHAYSATYVSKTGLGDPAFMKKIQAIVEKAGGAIHFVHLKANKKELMKRVRGASRKKFLKLVDPATMADILENKVKDLNSSAPVKSNLVIDNTKTSPKKVVDMVIKHFKLK
jgi:shikimate kinase